MGGADVGNSFRRCQKSSRERVDNCAMLGKFAGEGVALTEFKRGVGPAGRRSGAKERPTALTARGETGSLPEAGGDDELRELPLKEIVAQERCGSASAGGIELEMFDGITGVEVPNLGDLQTVKRGEIGLGHQKINGRAQWLAVG